MKAKPLVIGVGVALAVIKLTLLTAGAAVVIGTAAAVSGKDPKSKEEKPEEKKKE